MIGWCLVVALATGGRDDAARSELVAAARKLAAAESYTFLFVPDLAARAAAAATAPPSDPAVRSKVTLPRDEWRIEYSKYDPNHFQKGRAEFWRLGRRTIALGRADEWTLIEASARGADGEPDAAARGMARMVKEIDRIVAPHKFVVELVQSATSVERLPEAADAPADAAQHFIVTLAPASVTRLLRGAANELKPPAGGGHGKEAAGEGADADAPESTSEDDAANAGAAPAAAPAASPVAGSDHGVLRIDLVAGAIARVEVDVTGAGAKGARRISRRYDLSAIGTTDVNPPDPAWDLLEGDEGDAGSGRGTPRKAGRKAGGKNERKPRDGGDEAADDGSR